MKKTVFTSLLLAATLTVSAQQLPYQNPALSSQKRAEDLCSRLTLEEKAALMQNASPAIPRLGIPQFEWWSEALHGIARNGFATVFPQTTAMAASWDDALLYRVFCAASDEAVAKNNLARKDGHFARYQGVSIWTPNINIFRDPRWGRGQETYGEDPYLTSRMGMAVVNGLQGQPYQAGFDPIVERPQYYKTLACAKHFAVHSGPEWNRHVFDVEALPERDLWETYLPAFKALVQTSNVREIMCAYQRIDGQPCCGNNRYLQQILRDEWLYDGLVVSDCGAISDFFLPGHHHVVETQQEASAMAVRSGTDVECGSNYRSLTEAVSKGLIDEATINESVMRLLKARFEVGDFDSEDRVPWKRVGAEVIATPEHKALALQMAQESMTLLQNNNDMLPLAKDLRVAVMGPNATDSVMLWGNYNGYPTSTTSIYTGIRQKAPNAYYIDGCGFTRNEIRQSHFNEFANSEGQPGMTAIYWNNQEMRGTPVTQVTMREPINLSNGGNTVFAPGVELENFSAVYEGVFTPQASDELMVCLASDDMGRVIINGDTIINSWKARERVNIAEKSYRFEAGKQYQIRVEYVQNTAMAVLQFDIVKKAATTPAAIAAQAKDADVVVFVGGISPRLEGEEMKVSDPGFKGGDRTTIELPQAQRDIVSLLKEQGKRVVFVNCSGGAIALTTESQNCEAILQAWYAGEAGGKAVADVLFGDYNPGGKLPLTFYKSDADLPDFLDYSMRGRTYRYFKGEPLFAFGHGLSYTTFELGKPTYKNHTITLTVKNTGKREGTETIQVYVKNPADIEGPEKTLRAFKRVSLKAGEKQIVSIDLPRERFELWDTHTNTMRVQPGKHLIFVGTSSNDAKMQTLTTTLR